MKKLIVFDLDGTLAPSKSSLSPKTAALLHDLLGIIKVAVISGGAWTQFEKQLLTDLPQDDRLANLSLLPTCGTKFFQHKGNWKELYSEDLTAEQRKKIVDSLNIAAGEVTPASLLSITGWRLLYRLGNGSKSGAALRPC
jgi:hydroxymethylpyrimidine pyrophosphatase-like HAD family hydrolase